MGLGANEVRFYQQLAEHVPVETPHVHYAACDGRAQRFAIVFEDLGMRAARFTTVAERLMLDQVQVVMRELARLHAAFWDSPRLRSDLAWLKGPDNSPRIRVERFLCAVAVRPALRKFRELVPPELRAAAPRIIAARDRLEAAWAHGPLTLIHGDAHVGNLFFLKHTVGFLDWQVAQRGQGMRDVAYFLINSVPTELRRTHQRELIGSYLATLAQLGVAAPDFAQAWEQYRSHAFYTWIATVVTAAAATLQREPIVRAGLARSSTAVMDLDSLRALDTLASGP
jgi:Ser/Thr protein kinase RdoA (MazF antagonist)